MTAAVWIGALLLAAVAVGLLGFYVRWLVTTRRRTGRYGLLQHSLLVCPRCTGSFEYEWVPGASWTSIRLGAGRYMACPKCGQWSTFDVKAGLHPSPP